MKHQRIFPEDQKHWIRSIEILAGKRRTVGLVDIRSLQDLSDRAPMQEVFPRAACPDQCTCTSANVFRTVTIRKRQNRQTRRAATGSLMSTIATTVIVVQETHRF